MRTESEIRDRLAALERQYDEQDPPTSSMEEETEVAILRAMEELEWVLGEYDSDEEFTY